VSSRCSAEPGPPQTTAFGTTPALQRTARALRSVRGTLRALRRLVPQQILKELRMADTSKIKEHMDVISSDRKTVGQVDHLEGSDKIKLTKQSSPDGQHHHFIPVSWVDHVDQHVHLNKSGADVTSHWQHGQS
jgi:hypothetical protein